MTSGRFGGSNTNSADKCRSRQCGTASHRVRRARSTSRGDKIGIYRRIDFLAPDDPEVPEIWPYTQQVLDAVGIRTGCGHSEVMLTADGPRLIEVAARPAGGGHQLISELATGDNHIKRTVAHRVHGQVRENFDLVHHTRGIFISAPTEGYFRNREVFDGIESLKSFHWMKILHDENAIVPETVDLFTCLAWVILTHTNPPPSTRTTSESLPWSKPSASTPVDLRPCAPGARTPRRGPRLRDAR